MARLIFVPFNNLGSGVDPDCQGSFLADAFEAVEEHHLEEGERAKCFIYLSGVCDGLLRGLPKLPAWLDSIEVLIEKTFNQKNADAIALTKCGEEPQDVICFRLVPTGCLEDADIKKLRDRKSVV